MEVSYDTVLGSDCLIPHLTHLLSQAVSLFVLTALHVVLGSVVSIAHLPEYRTPR